MESGYLFASINHLHWTANIFVDTFSDLLDFYFSLYNNKVILGDFNLKLIDPVMRTFLNEQDLISLMKNKTCFKEKGLSIGLILANRIFRLKTLLLLKVV